MRSQGILIIFAYQLLTRLTFTLATTKSTFDPIVMCSLVPNNTKINDPRACNAWIECINGESIEGKCDGTLFYDRNAQTCVSPEDTTCLSSDPCAATPKDTGFVADPYSCNGYYYCDEGDGSRGECPVGMNFNPSTEDCVRNLPCHLPMSPESYCNVVPDGVFIKNTSNCNGYEMCWESELISGTCPTGFYYNPIKGGCDYPSNVDCFEATTPPPVAPPVEQCTKNGDFISDDYSCNGYYLCLETSDGDYKLKHGTCPDGRFFDPTDGGSCIYRTQIACEFDRCVGMGSSGIQLANVPNDGCVGFAICQNGVEIGSGLCPDEQYFNEVTQKCTTAVISYPACALQLTTTTTSTLD